MRINFEVRKSEGNIFIEFRKYIVFDDYFIVFIYLVSVIIVSVHFYEFLYTFLYQNCKKSKKKMTTSTFCQIFGKRSQWLTVHEFFFIIVNWSFKVNLNFVKFGGKFEYSLLSTLFLVILENFRPQRMHSTLFNIALFCRSPSFV